MKKITVISLCFFLLCACASSFKAQIATQEGGPNDKAAITVHLIMENPQSLMKVWINKPMPLSSYTLEEKEFQRSLNEKTADGIITYSPISAEKQWTSIDSEEITPYTWKWIDFELLESDGTLTKIALCRPHWWLREVGADSVGRRVYLNMPELSSKGFATVKAIRVNQLDTRFWNENRKDNFVSRPITGKFEHESNDVYHLYFGNNAEPLGVTGLHPIWSLDRNNWVRASELKIGEKIKTQNGLTFLKFRTTSNKRQKVYNLEVYKDHNFLVSTDKILVHNTCWQERLARFTEYAKSLDPNKLKSQNETIEQLENAFKYLEKSRTDDKVLKLVGETNVTTLSNGTKQIMQAGKGNYTLVRPDGGFQIIRAGKILVDKFKSK